MDFFYFIFIIIAIVFIYCGGFSWTAVTGHRCKALEDFPLAAAGSLAVSSGIRVYALELPLGLSYVYSESFCVWMPFFLIAWKHLKY